MSDATSDGWLGRVRHWIRHGGADEPGLPGTMLGMALYWRLWATMVMAAVPLFAGLALLQYVNPPSAVLVTAVAAWLLAPWAMRVSPKYEVSTNY